MPREVSVNSICATWASAKLQQPCLAFRNFTEQNTLVMCPGTWVIIAGAKTVRSRRVHGPADQLSARLSERVVSSVHRGLCHTISALRAWSGVCRSLIRARRSGLESLHSESPTWTGCLEGAFPRWHRTACLKCPDVQSACWLGQRPAHIPAPTPLP
eukprot:366077-Chlamydomonas_euryale.AAC.1